MATRKAPPGSTRRRGRGRPREATGTREALLAAATELFADRGYDGVAVREIADKAGVNPAMVSYHFGGKRQLYRAIVDATFSDIVARAEALAAAPRPAPELLRELIATIGELATRQHPYFCTMMLREVLAGGQRLEARVLDKPVRVLGAVRRLVTRGVQDGDFRPVDPLLTHLSLVGSLVFFFATSRFRERVLADRRLALAPPDPTAYVRHIQDLITHGLAAPGAAAARRS
jgi:TetR/AcrR family transcriptional regulator